MLLLLGAVVCEASYVVIGKRLTGNVSAKRISAIVNLWGLALVTPLGLWQATRFDFSVVRPATWGLLLFYAIAASMATVWLWMTGLKHVPASSAGVFTVFLPITAGPWAWCCSASTSARCRPWPYGLALTGVVLATWPSRVRAASPQRTRGSSVCRSNEARVARPVGRAECQGSSDT